MIRTVPRSGRSRGGSARPEAMDTPYDCQQSVAGWAFWPHTVEMTLGEVLPPPPLQQVGIGVVTPYDFALHRELWRWVPDDVSLYVTRLRYAPLPVTVDMAVHVSDADNVVAGAANVLAVSPMV